MTLFGNVQHSQTGRADSAVTQLLTTLASLNANLEQSTQQSKAHHEVTGRGIAMSYLAMQGGMRAVANANPPAMATLGGNADLLMSAIGSDRTVTHKIVQITSLINGLRNSWNDLGSSQKEYAINSGIAMTAMIGTLHYGPSVAKWIRETPARMNRAGDQFLLGRTYGNWGGAAQGYGVQGVGYALNAALGENVVGDTLQVGGAAYGGYHMLRGTMAATAGMRASGSMATRFAGRAIPVAAGALVAADIYASLPRGADDPEAYSGIAARHGQFASLAERGSRSLNSANAWPVLMNAYARMGSNDGPVDIRTAMERAGVAVPQRPLFSREGGVSGFFGAIGDAASRTYSAVRPWSQTEVRAVNDQQYGVNTILNAPEGRRRQLMQALNFQSQQIDIGDLHSMVQQQAVMPEMQQEAFKNLTDALNRVTAEIAHQNGSASGVAGVSTAELGAFIQNIFKTITA